METMGNDNKKDGSDPRRRIIIQPNIGLDEYDRWSVVVMLNTILADEAILTAKTSSAYWHIHGTELLSIQPLFEAQLKQLSSISHDVAERIRILGGFVISSFKEILHETRLEEQPGEVPNLMRLLADHEASIRFLREDAHKCLDAYEDLGTFDLLTQILRVHEKMAWNLRSCLQPDLTPAEIERSKNGPTRR